MTKPQGPKGQLQGDIFWSNGQQPLAEAQVALLKAVDQSGSISKAAKLVGISYKTAWDRIDAMNNMSSQALVSRTTGGAQGGGTRLTEHGLRIVAGFEQLQDEHRRFIAQLGNKVQSLNDVASFMKGGSLHTSARNQFRGLIRRITASAINAEVELDIGAGQPLVAMITRDSVERLGLVEGSEVIALVKASSVIVSTDTAIQTSARNKLVGKVARVLTGSVNSDVTLDIGGGKAVSAIVTNESAKSLALAEGVDACALFKAPSVILLKEG